MSAAIQSRKWITLTEMWRCTHLLVLSLGLSRYMGAFKLFVSRLTFLWKKSGKKFLVLYLKECTAHVIAYLNHTTRQPKADSIGVRLSRAGLPTVIPGPLRFAIMQFRLLGGLKDGLVTRSVLTVLSYYRVINFVAKPSLATVTAPFTGVSPLLDVIELEKVVNLFAIPRLRGLTWFISESAGPNGPRATWWSGVDCLAFLKHPRLWMNWVCFAFISGHYAPLAWFLLIQLISIPGLAIIGALGGNVPSKLGRLAALDKDGAGKRRIVAITDFWTQLVFKPFHDALFAVLKDIPQDGTFDQWKPVEEWVLPRLRLGAPAFSFDLTAATDRLPIHFQKQVFQMLFGKWTAYFWIELLNRDWWFQGNPIRYAVGQPIGAYSSWAMLAFCHHVVVQLAALRAGWRSWFPYYAVLGDDLVIADREVANHYLAIMRHLGVPINLHKSIVSESGFIEFAKRWVSATRGEVSALSPGLLLASLRNSYLFAVITVHLFERGWLNFPEQLKGALSALAAARRNISPRLLALMYATIIGPSGLLRNSGHVTAFAESWFTTITKLPMGSAMPYIILAFRSMVESDMADKSKAGWANLEYFILNWMKRPILLGPAWVAGVLSVPLILISPGFWIYFVTVFKGRSPSYSASLNLYGLINPSEADRPGAIMFDLLGLEDLASIEWKRRPEIKHQFGLVTDLMKIVDQQLQEDLRACSSTALTVLSETTLPTED